MSLPLQSIVIINSIQFKILALIKNSYLLQGLNFNNWELQNKLFTISKEKLEQENTSNG